MGKSTIKTKYDPFRAKVIKDLMTETGYTQTFVREAVKGLKKSLAAEEIRKEFNNRYAKIKEALKTN